MERLRLKDLRSLLEFLRPAYAVSDLDAFSQHVMTAVPALVPSDITVCSQMDRRRQQFKWAHDVSDFFFTGITRIFRRTAHEHPLVAHYRRTGDGGAFKLSDFLTRRQLHRLRLYDEIYRPLGCEHEMAFWLAPHPGLEVVFAVHRARRDFSERDRLLLNVVRSHLVEIQRSATELTVVKQQLALLEQELEDLGQGLVFLDRRGHIVQTSGRALGLLAEYFFDSRSDRLPETLQRWIRVQEALLEPGDDVPAPRQPLVVEVEGKRLVVRLAPHPTHRLLLLEEQRTAHDAGSLEPLGLSPREAEVLAWVVEGKTNPETAMILGISPRTVQTHLERIYGKLGVASRTAAVAHALKRGGLRGATGQSSRVV